MERKKCPECGYKFKGVDMDSNVCPKCFTHIDDEKYCSPLSSIQPIKSRMTTIVITRQLLKRRPMSAKSKCHLFQRQNQTSMAITNAKENLRLTMITQNLIHHHKQMILKKNLNIKLMRNIVMMDMMK